MIALFYKLLDVFSNNFFNKILKSFGVGVISGTAIYLIANKWIEYVVTRSSEMPYLGLLSLFGIDAALSIILSSILSRAFFESQKMTIGRKS